jgi:guanylate kinase
MKGKAIIVSAPSGAGKTTIVKDLLVRFPGLVFSVSACSRTRRHNEQDGKDYYFITPEEFRARIARDEFIEWEEVYPGSYYGTLKSDVERIWAEGKNVIFDVDVAGGLNLKKYFGKEALALFIQPPSPSELEVRLRNRNTEDEESLKKRLSKSVYELTFAGQFDEVVVNDDLGSACKKAGTLVTEFLDGSTHELPGSEK